jgi:cyclopropane-fatty-acyl-phospholipid synthase
MLWENKLAQWSAGVRSRANLPARLTLWDGKSYDFGEFGGADGAAAPSVTLHVKSPAALSLMLQPTLDNLGEAYVKSKIDIEGKLSDVIDIAYGRRRCR